MSRNDAIAASLDYHYTEKDSPQPHVPLILGLLKTNSEASLEKNHMKTDILCKLIHTCSLESPSLCQEWRVVLSCLWRWSPHLGSPLHPELVLPPHSREYSSDLPTKIFYMIWQRPFSWKIAIQRYVCLTITTTCAHSDPEPECPRLSCSQCLNSGEEKDIKTSYQKTPN